MPALLHYTLVIFFIWLLAGAAWHKFRHPSYYMELVCGHFPSLPVKAGVAVFAVAVAEILLAAGLILDPAGGRAFVGTAVLLSGYTLMMLRHLADGRAAMNCGCAGPDSDLAISPVIIGRNVILVFLALAGAVPPASGGLTAGALALAVLAGLFLIMVYLCVEQLLVNARQFRQSWG